MRIWVDADACPGVIKDILYRVANRTQIMVTLIANQMLHVPPSPWIQARQVSAGADVADQSIVDQVTAYDVVITADIPLAALVIEKQAWVIDPRGDLIDSHSIEARLSLRNFMQDLRDNGVQTSGPAPFTDKDSRAFANQLDRLITRVQRQSKP